MLNNAKQTIVILGDKSIHRDKMGIFQRGHDKYFKTRQN